MWCCTEWQVAFCAHCEFVEYSSGSRVAIRLGHLSLWQPNPTDLPHRWNKHSAGINYLMSIAKCIPAACRAVHCHGASGETGASSCVPADQRRPANPGNVAGEAEQGRWMERVVHGLEWVYKGSGFSGSCWTLIPSLAWSNFTNEPVLVISTAGAGLRWATEPAGAYLTNLNVPFPWGYHPRLKLPCEIQQLPLHHCILGD